jgi:hypothetical protein
MEIHKPKPWHGWREFLKEVGIIVIGVLIALGAEQAVEALQWHGKVAIVRKSILGELANDRARWELDVVEARCLSRDIDLLDRRAQEGGSAAAAPTPSGLLQTGRTLFWMHSASWNLATTSQTLDHFPIDQQLAVRRYHAPSGRYRKGGGPERTSSSPHSSLSRRTGPARTPRSPQEPEGETRLFDPQSGLYGAALRCGRGEAESNGLCA